MRRTRHVIAVMVVATALCADRAAQAAPEVRTQTTSGFARNFATKITTNLRRAVAQNALQPARTMETARTFPLVIREEASGVRSEFSPFQFRLPPPTR
jgi:hypothetical protein